MASSILILLLLTEFCVISNVQGYYRKTPTEPEGHFNASLELICLFKKSNADAQSFSWFHDKTSISDETSDYSTAKQADKSTLTIQNLRLENENYVYWFGQIDENGVENRACEFHKIKLFPQILTDRIDEKLTTESITVRRDGGDSVRFTCRLDDLTDSSLISKWQFSPENKDFHDLPNAILVKDNDLIIDKIEKHHRGYYQCSFENHPRTATVLLRMKDRFAAWWPFLAIVVVVTIAVIIILVIEKRRKAAQKAAAAAADREKTNDPLVVQTSKFDTEDNKKSNVVA